MHPCDYYWKIDCPSQSTDVCLMDISSELTRLYTAETPHTHAVAYNYSSPFLTSTDLLVLHPNPLHEITSVSAPFIRISLGDAL